MPWTCLRGRWGARVALATNATAVPAEDAAGIELFGATEQVATAKAEALEPQAENEAGRGLRMAPREGAIDRKRARLADAKGRATDGASEPDLAVARGSE